MKKLIIALLLMFSFMASAQDTFIMKYNRVYNCVDKKNTLCVVNVVFNSKISKSDIILYINKSEPMNYYRASQDVEKGKTEDGEEFQMIPCIGESGEKVMFILYADGALKIIFNNGNAMEFYEN